MSLETIFRMIFIALLLIALSVSAYYRTKARRSSPERINRREEGIALLVTLRLGGLVLMASVLAYVINPAWMSWATLPLPVWVRWLGVLGGLISVPLVIWMFRSLGKNITDTVVTRREHSLVTHGPYRFIRQPLYTFGALFYFSLSLIAASWWIALLSGLALVLLAQRTPIEESKLIERFGDDYRKYMERTGRFFPRLSRSAIDGDWEAQGI